jgi:hypothetical protein
VTQQPYAPQPVYPPQAPPQQYQPPAPQYPQAPPQQYAQAYQQPYGAPQAPPQQAAQGSLDAFYSQPSAASGPSISWSVTVNGVVQQKPLGTTYAGIVARDVTHADIQQDSDPKTGALKTYKDGRPKFFMKVPLKVAPSPEFPEGEATWYVRGQARDELVRAMSEAGINEPGAAPKGGDAVSVTLVERRPPRNGQGMPANVVQVRYQRSGVQEATAAPSPAPVAQPAPVQPPAQPEQQYAPPVSEPAKQFQQPVQAPVEVPAQPVQAQAPAQPAPVPPADLDEAQQALLARLTGQGS